VAVVTPFLTTASRDHQSRTSRANHDSSPGRCLGVFRVFGRRGLRNAACSRPDSFRPSGRSRRSQPCLARLACPTCGTGCRIRVARPAVNPTSRSACVVTSARPNACWWRVAIAVGWSSMSILTRSRRHVRGAIGSLNSSRSPAVRPRTPAVTYCSARAVVLTEQEPLDPVSRRRWFSASTPARLTSCRQLVSGRGSYT
jgi:hypothetical protein